MTGFERKVKSRINTWTNEFRPISNCLFPLPVLVMLIPSAGDGLGVAGFVGLCWCMYVGLLGSLKDFGTCVDTCGK